MKTANSFLIGIDGGGTSCRARISDLDGNILGEAKAGSANVFQNADIAWQSVYQSTRLALAEAGLSEAESSNCHVVAGLAGAEFQDSAERFLSQVQGFADFQLLNDAQTACLGAHAGEDGAVFVIGTGTIGVAYEKNAWRRVGGWGFPLDDIGSGAWLGQQALRIALRVKDKMLPGSILADLVWQEFPNGSDQLIEWSSTAGSGAYGKFAPLVLKAFAEADPNAQNIVELQTQSLTDQINTLNPNDQPICLMGGLSHWVAEYLPDSIKKQLKPSKGDALSGALSFANRRIAS